MAEQPSCQDCGAYLQPIRRGGEDRLRCPWARDEERTFKGRIFCGRPLKDRIQGGLAREMKA